ncbi:MAG: FHA domain-containing protein [Planctomycetota bacterium]
MAKFRIHWPDGRTQEYAIDRTITMIGRTRDNDLKLADRSVSRKQCKIEGRPGNYAVVDLDSRNGTLVNGARISTSQLRHNDTLTIGTIRLVLLEEDAPAAGGDVSACPSCGAPLKDGDVLCVKCGTFFKHGASFFGGAKRKRGLLLAVIVIAVLVLAAAGIAAFLAMRPPRAVPGADAAGRRERIIQIVRGIKTPTTGTYGELLDRLNLASTEMHWVIEDRGLDIYRVVLSFARPAGEQRMVFNVDLQSGDGDDELKEFIFDDF